MLGKNRGIMKQISISLILAILLLSKIFSQDLSFRNYSGYYVSPGVNISWDFSGAFIIGSKLSIGILKNGSFYNVTFGILNSNDKARYPYYYIECQYGVSSQYLESKGVILLNGIGAGIGIHTNGEEKIISYKVSLFSGNTIFINASFLYDKKINPDIGFEAVLPFPVISLK